MCWFINEVCKKNPNIYVFGKLYTKKILHEFLSKHCKSKEFHYFWGNLKQNNVLIFKIAADEIFYRDYLNDILLEMFPQEKVMLAIDRYCNIGTKDNLVLSIKISDLINILIEFYWELDEICVFDETYDFFFAVNHNFEVFICGKFDNIGLCEIIHKAVNENIILSMIYTPKTFCFLR